MTLDSALQLFTVAVSSGLIIGLIAGVAYNSIFRGR